MTCTFINAVPTAATAIISGKVLDIYGRPVVNISVSATNPATGESHSARTNTFGNYRFTELPVGESYVIAVRSKKYLFAVDSRIVMLMDDLSEQDFTAIPLE